MSYERLVDDREGELKRLCEFANVPFGPRMQALCNQSFPLSKYTLSPPDADKWRRHETEIEAVIPGLEDIAARLASL